MESARRARPPRYEASAQRTDEGWLITVVQPCHFSVKVRSLAEAECAVERALVTRGSRLRVPIELHIYWYH
jgi:hypothetical protein